MARDNILLQKKLFQKKVSLPNGRTFFTRCERVRRSNLRSNVRVARIFGLLGLLGMPNIYYASVKRVSNKKINRVLQSDLAN